MLRTANPKNFKNVTFDTLSFFFCLMQLDERVLSNCDVTVKNVLSLCVRSVPFSTSISRSRYHYRHRTGNLTMISSLRKSSNPFWSTISSYIRSVMLRDDRQVNDLRRSLRYLISWRLDENFARRKFVYRVCTFAVHARGHVTLYANNVYIHYIDRHIRFVPPSWLQYTLRRKSQQRSNAGRTKVHAVCTSNLAFHRVVICAERNRIFSTIIIIGVIVVVIVLSSCTTVSSASCFCKIERFKFIYCLVLHMNLREL